MEHFPWPTTAYFLFDDLGSIHRFWRWWYETHLILCLLTVADLPGPIALYIGRKTSIWLACGMCVVANVVMMTTTSIGGLYAGRFVIGLANGLFMTFAQLYLQVR